MVQSERKLVVKLRITKRAVTCIWKKNNKTMPDAGVQWHNIRMDKREWGGTHMSCFVSIFSFELEVVRRIVIEST